MKIRAFIFIIIASVLWGTSGIFVNNLSPYGFSSLQMTAVRATVSFLFLLIFVLIKDRKLFRTKLVDLLIFALGGLGLFGTSSCYYASMQMTSISTAVVLMYTAPILVTVFSVIFMKEKLTLLKIISIACMVVGCCFVSGLIGGFKFDVVGILLGLLSGFAYATYNVATKIAVMRKNSSVTASFYSIMFMALFAISFSSPWEIPFHIAKEPVITVPFIIGLGVVTHVIPYLLYSNAMSYLPAGTTTAIGIIEPMSATLFSVFVYQEVLDVWAIIGIILILMAVFMLSRAESDKYEKRSK
ncbi:MAG: hypothetical protein E7353_08920 [Clostridiales bacterium]|nr:hypothetical protein [Clostridiales bacterium]